MMRRGRSDRKDSTSKFISVILRHKPETIGIELDEHGWADVDELIRGTARLPDTKTSLIIAGIGAVLTVPLMPIRSLMIAAWVRGLKE